MKKLIMTAAVVACASIVTAQVVSDNVVGYVKQATPSGGDFTIVNVNGFGTADIQDLIVNLDDLNSGGSLKGNAAGALAVVDKLHVYTGTGYNTYGLYNTGSTKYWMISTSGGWTSAGAAGAAVATITRGQSVWFQTGDGGFASQAITLGEVPNDVNTSVDLVGDYTLVSYPFTSSINIQDLEITNAVAGGSIKGNAAGAFAAVDKLHLWTGTGYASYGLYDTGSTTYWMVSTSGGWSSAGAAEASDAVIELGKGIWYESVNGAKTVGFTQNYNLD